MKILILSREKGNEADDPLNEPAIKQIRNILNLGANSGSFINPLLQ
jgi:hypothetical protein